MPIVVSVMDRSEWGANTDNIAIVDSTLKTITWIPRDLWSPMLGDRVNRAFALGGHPMLLQALTEQSLSADGSLCLLRRAVVRALRGISVRVRVDKTLRYRYPILPESNIEDGEKIVEFHPPFESLTGERLHQWIGARYGMPGTAGTDFARIHRQQVLIRQLVEDGFDFQRTMVDKRLVSISGPRVIDELRWVTNGWSYEVIDDVQPVRINEKSVLVRPPTEY